MTKLTPAVQAVLDFVKEICPVPADEIAAAALRAAADQGEILFNEYDDPVQAITVEDLLAIAKELAAQ